MVAAGCTAAVGAHLVSVDMTLMSYASGVSVTSPGAVSFNLPFMSASTMSPPLGIAGFSRGPSMATAVVCAPAAFNVPDGWTEFAGRSIRSGFLDAACTNFHTTSTSSPTFAVAGAVISALVVPSTGGRPAAAGGTQRVAYDTSAACADPAVTRAARPPRRAPARGSPRPLFSARGPV
ncbi:hypothetical protein SALBM311S_07732 [Streptomyces alboniger]